MVTAVADRRQHQVQMPRTKVDDAVTRSLISQRNAVASMAAQEALPIAETVRDSHGHLHRAAYRINLRCAVNNAAHSFSEEFYVVEDLGQYDALLRKNN